MKENSSKKGWVVTEEAREKLWKQWAIDGMPKDKQRLAMAVWEGAILAVTQGLDQNLDERMRQAGMMTIDQMLDGSMLDGPAGAFERKPTVLTPRPSA